MTNAFAVKLTNDVHHITRIYGCIIPSTCTADLLFLSFFYGVTHAPSHASAEACLQAGPMRNPRDATV